MLSLGIYPKKNQTGVPINVYYLLVIMETQVYSESIIIRYAKYVTAQT